MRLLSILWAGGVVGCALLGCHRPPKAVAAPAADSPRTIRFGSGGGFTGMTTTYALRSTGQLDRRAAMPADTAKPFASVKALPAEAVAKFFAALDALPADSLTGRTPGNISYFLEGRTAAGKTVALTWGPSGKGAPRGARLLYQSLTDLATAGQ